ncbi:Flp1 family type IVb pilin [Paenibacillus apiarius]|uniref:Multidrug transporter n=1 Tax=Paenibacillus apiarius TaxID=46240 RepID=A0ABT4DUJ5_9BACL|nr:Flp1 family type IVb pilin [Paenibacillus apiarius]MCY9514435.1 multidrug transporter [Paenibacillus apiarius]MCY9521027.1 multidrug transporter [Paenibacillus apiarius]MCY9551873.1 multidrug transporter [Paenibacillus apiarius]MCY9557761.1 multidrug transporter [Paenibacillus apiarius]MCY9684448.1 multidrug transporter [Paenibacillus apiarius]
MMQLQYIWRRLWQEEDGLGMVEIVVIIAVIVVLALVFRKNITAFLENLIGRAEKETDKIFKP